MAEYRVDVTVIGAGQAGLSALYHLQHRGFVPFSRARPRERTFIGLDAEARPGGAWQHRWDSLTMRTVNGIFGLPGMPVPEGEAVADGRSNVVLPQYFAAYEERFGFDVRRPVQVRRVHRRSPAPTSAPAGRLITETVGPGDRRDTWVSDHVINATGTWTRPYVPHYPGRERFAGRQVHTHDYVSNAEFAGQRVIVVGMGVSATQLLEEISRVADTFWVTRREPVWETVTGEARRRRLAEGVRRVDERTRLGLPPVSVVSVTGMHRSAWVEAADARGALVRHPMFTAIEEHGVRMPDGSFEPADAIVWATGFRPAIDHLAPLRLRTAAGGVRVVNGRAVDEPRLFLIGYGPSQSTVGANRAGRDAVHAIVTGAGARNPGVHNGNRS